MKCVAVASFLQRAVGAAVKGADQLQSAVPLVLWPVEKFMTALLQHPKGELLLSNEHFSVDRTWIEAGASHKSFKPQDGSGDGDGGENVHGQKRKNDTPASTPDPDSRLYRKAQGREAKLCYMGHALMRAPCP